MLLKAGRFRSKELLISPKQSQKGYTSAIKLPDIGQIGA